MTSTPADSCVFCGIIAGQLPASQVYQDDQTVAFMDVRPLTSGHLLVVPRVHAASLEVLDEDTGTLVFAVAHRLARALRNSAVPCEGVNFFLADGVAAGQEVFHVHLHVIPRTPGDGFRLKGRPRTPGRLSASTRRTVCVRKSWPVVSSDAIRWISCALASRRRRSDSLISRST